jgi:hypothetical protein
MKDDLGAVNALATDTKEAMATIENFILMMKGKLMVGRRDWIQARKSMEALLNVFFSPVGSRACEIFSFFREVIMEQLQLGRRVKTDEESTRNQKQM